MIAICPGPRGLSLLALFLMAPTLLGQSGEGNRSELKPQEKPFLIQEVHPPQIVDFDVKNGVLFYLGGVAIKIGDMDLRCDNLLAWLSTGSDSKDSEESAKSKGLNGLGRFVKEIYAEGTVYLRHKGQSLRANRLFLDLENQRGIVLDAKAVYAFRHRKRDQTLQVQAGELRILSARRIQARRAQISNTRFPIPLFQLTVDDLELLLDVEDDGKPSKEKRPAENGLRFDSKGNVLHIARVPVLWFPDFAGGTSGGRSIRYLDSIGYQRSNRFGHQFHVRVGDDIFLEDGSRWGHWSVLGTWLSKRGWGGGADLVYERDDYQGRLLTRYQRDHGTDNPFGEPGTKNRGRIAWEHRQFLPHKIQLDLELALLSDRAVYPVYYEREFKTRKPPENIIHLKKDWFRSQISLRAQKRFNRFLSTTESLPELRYELVTEPLFDIASRPVYLNTSLRIGKKNYRPGLNDPLPARSSFRVDADTLLEHPIALGPLTFTPFVGARSTWYENDLRGDDRHRFGLTYGATLTGQAWKAYDTQGGWMDLDGLRHVFYPSITFRDTVGVRVQPSELGFFDDVESFRDQREVEFRLRNLFQTRRKGPKGTVVSNFVDLDLRQSWFPNPADNHGRPFGNLDVDLLVRVTPELQVSTDFEWGWYGRGLEVYNLVVGYQPEEDLQAAMGFRHYDGSYDAVFGQIQVRLEEKWLLTVGSSYEFRESRSLEHSLRFARISDESVLEVELRADVAENNYGFGIAFSPRMFFNPRRGIRSLGRDPRLRFPGRGVGH